MSTHSQEQLRRAAAAFAIDGSFEGGNPCEGGIRFLADHLAGATDFRLHRPGENLARTQFAFVRAMQEQTEEMARIMATAAANHPSQS